MERKIAAGATFVVTQPLIEKNAVVDRLLEKYPDIPVIVEAWMSKKLCYCPGSRLHHSGSGLRPIATQMLHQTYPNAGISGIAWFQEAVRFD